MKGKRNGKGKKGGGRESGRKRMKGIKLNEEGRKEIMEEGIKERRYTEGSKKEVNKETG